LIMERKSFFYLHLEHQRKSDPMMAYRMLIYQANIWQQFEKQYPKEKIPIIFPMVLYQGKSSWTAPLSFHEFLAVPDFLRPFVPEFNYSLMDLSHLSDEQIKGELSVKVALLLMKHINSPKLEELLSKTIFPLLIELETKNTGLEYLETFLYYLSSSNEHLNKDQVIRKIQGLPTSTQIDRKIMTLVEQWKEEAVEQERESMAWMLLQTKFPKTASNYRSKLKSLSSDELQKFSLQIINASTINELFRR